MLTLMVLPMDTLCRQSVSTFNLSGDIPDIMAMAQDIGDSWDCLLTSGMAEAIDIVTGKPQDLERVLEVFALNVCRSPSSLLLKDPTLFSEHWP